MSQEEIDVELREFDRLIAHELRVSNTDAPLAEKHAIAAKSLRARKAAFIVYNKEMEFA